MQELNCVFYNILASLFFVTYEGIKTTTQCKVPKEYHSLLHMSAASVAEMVMSIRNFN